MTAKYLSFLAGACVLAATPVSVQAAPRFEGALIVFAKSGTCPDYNPVGTELTVRFRPGGIGDNPTDTGFTFMWYNGGFNIRVPGAITSSFKAGNLSEMFDFVDTSKIATIRFTSQKPASITPTSPSVFAIGEITDFDGMPGCTVRFRMSAVKRLN